MKIRKTLRKEISLYEFEGNLGSVAEELQNMYDEYKDEYEDVFLEPDTVRDYYDEYACFNLIGVREETTEEKRKRFAENKKQKKLQEERERKEYERLKKKFEAGKKKPTERDEKRYNHLKKKIEK